jgi:class 3 adenylate cyclase
VLFCDLVGSTELSARLDPEDLRAIMADYHRATAAVIERFEGHVARYLGDGGLAYFGWPRAHEDDAERAVRAGLELVEAVAQLEPHAEVRLQARVGIATGQVVVGDLVGEGATRDEAVVGETPNLAARLQALAEPGSVVIGQATRKLIGGLFDLDDLGPQRLQGFAEPLGAKAAPRGASRRDRPRASRLWSAGRRRSRCCCAAGARRATAKAKWCCCRASPVSASHASCASCVRGSRASPTSAYSANARPTTRPARCIR